MYETRDSVPLRLRYASSAWRVVYTCDFWGSCRLHFVFVYKPKHNSAHPQLSLSRRLLPPLAHPSHVPRTRRRNSGLPVALKTDLQEGSALVSGSRDNSVKVWDVASACRRHEAENGVDPAASLAGVLCSI